MGGGGLHLLHFILKPPPGEGRVSFSHFISNTVAALQDEAQVLRGRRSQDRDTRGLSDLGSVVCFCRARTRGAVVPIWVVGHSAGRGSPLKDTSGARAEPDHQSLRTFSYRETQWGSDCGTIHNLLYL